VKVVDIVLITY